MREAEPETAVANVLEYVAAWNEPDAAARLKLLERCWADDGALVGCGHQFNEDLLYAGVDTVAIPQTISTG
jgi:hypothetical protein